MGQSSSILMMDFHLGTWDANLTSFVTDDTWGVHVILHGAANRFETCIHMINSPPRHYDVMICSNTLVLGHAHELNVHKNRLHLV